MTFIVTLFLKSYLIQRSHDTPLPMSSQFYVEIEHIVWYDFGFDWHRHQFLTVTISLKSDHLSTLHEYLTSPARAISI